MVAPRDESGGQLKHSAAKLAAKVTATVDISHKI
jgi:hypothetical protein